MKKTKLPTHPSHELTRQANCPRRMKPTVFDKWSGKTINIRDTISPTSDTISSNLNTIHTMAVKECLDSYRSNSILSQPASDISKSEQTLSRKTRRTLTQLCAGKSPVHNCVKVRLVLRDRVCSDLLMSDAGCDKMEFDLYESRRTL